MSDFEEFMQAIQQQVEARLGELERKKEKLVFYDYLTNEPPEGAPLIIYGVDNAEKHKYAFALYKNGNFEEVMVPRGASGSYLILYWAELPKDLETYMQG